MDAPTVLYALRWLIHDTFRQTLTSRVFWIMLGLSFFCIVFCLGVRVEGGAVRDSSGQELFDKEGKPLVGQKSGRLTLLYGTIPIEFRGLPEKEVHFVMTFFASWIGGPVGIVIALIFAAGFVPDALQPSAASVLLAKPVPRWLFLLGKFVGVVCFVALHVTIFFVGTWIALGMGTGIWYPEYLLGIPLMVFHFATIYSFSILVAVLTRSTMACVVGSVLFWIVCFGVNLGRNFAVSFETLNPDGPALPGFTLFLADAGYWLLPKPIDLVLMLEKALNLESNMVGWADWDTSRAMLAKDLFHPIASIFTSCLFPIFALWAAASHLAKTDY